MIRTVIALILMLALVLVGCESSQQSPGSDQTVAPVEQAHKEILLEQIDQKYENPEAHYRLGKIPADV